MRSFDFTDLGDVVRAVWWQGSDLLAARLLYPGLYTLDYYLRRRAFRSPRDAAYDTVLWLRHNSG